jgi:hypothetical protein
MIVRAISAMPAWASEGGTSSSGKLTFGAPTIDQDQGAWVIDYRFKYRGETEMIVMPEEITGKVEAWVSNSRVSSHAMPRFSSLIFPNPGKGDVLSTVIASATDEYRCEERLFLSAWVEEGAPVAKPPSNLERLRVPPGAVVRVRLRFEHRHPIFGDYDPLLAKRTLTLNLGKEVIKDLIVMDQEKRKAHPTFRWTEIPQDRLDSRQFVSAPNSILLEAGSSGHQYYRFPERPVRYSSQMRLRFWYLIAVGTEGEAKVRVAQFKDTPTSWRILNSGGFEQSLTTVGRWTKVDRIVLTEPQATTMTLEFKITGDFEVAEMWIDDVSLEPVEASSEVEGP